MRLAYSVQEKGYGTNATRATWLYCVQTALLCRYSRCKMMMRIGANEG